MNSRELLIRRSTSQLLNRRIEGGPEAAVRTLLAVQAQDRTAWRLALRARVDGISAADVDRALSDDRSLLVAWLNRGTLHLVCSDDYAWLRALTAPTQATSNARRLLQEGIPPDEADRAVTLIEGMLSSDGPLTRTQLRERLSERGVRTEGQALVHLLFAAVIRGVAVQGPMRGVHHAFVHARDWLGQRAEPPTGEWRERALAELARRYLTGHGPATAADLAKWSGLPLRDARLGLQRVAREVVELDDGLLDLAGRWRPRAAAAALLATLPARLLPQWDPVMVGWRERGLLLAPGHESVVIPDGGGLFRPVATVDGAVAATWGIARSGDRVAIHIDPFEPLEPAVSAVLRVEAEGVARFEGRTLSE
jgi:hypothetical protein